MHAKIMRIESPMNQACHVTAWGQVMRLDGMPFTERDGRATSLGGVAVACALLGLFAWIGYAMFATRGINAVSARDMVSANRMASYAGWSSLAQMVLGIFAVGLGWLATTRERGSRLARRLGAAGLGLGAFVLVLLILLV